MAEIPKYAPRDAQIAPEKKALIGVLIAWNLVVWSGLGYMVTHYGPFQPTDPSADNPTLLSDVSPNNLPDLSPVAATATRPAQPPKPIQKEVEAPRDFFLVGQFNLAGFAEAGHFQPAPPLFLFIKKPDETTIKAYVNPKALEASDNPEAIFDWQNPINAAFLNVTGKKNGKFEGFVVQTGHSGSIALVDELPLEKLRQAMEDNGKLGFGPSQYYANVETLKKSGVTLIQGKLLPRVTANEVDSSGRGLTETVSAKAEIKSIMRLSPEKTAASWKTFRDAWGKPGLYVNILDFVDPYEKVNIDPTTDIVLMFCGEKTFPGEKIPAGVPYYQASRYLVVITLAK